MVAGTIPILTSLKDRFVLSVPKAMSQQQRSPTPPPNAAPLTRAMVGFEHSFKRFINRAILRASSLFSSKLFSPRVRMY